MALRESPVAIRVADQEEPRGAVGAAPEHDAASARLPLSPPPLLAPLHQNTLNEKYFRGFAWMSDRSCRSWIIVSVVSRYRLESDTSRPGGPLRFAMGGIPLPAAGGAPPRPPRSL